MRITSQYKAFVFDMDGLLIDSETVAFETFQDACIELSIECPFDEYKGCIGTAGKERDKILQRALGGEQHMSALSEIWKRKYSQRIKNRSIPVKKGVHVFLEHLNNYNKPKIVATSTLTSLAEEKLESCGLLHYFDKVIGGETVANPKPCPDIYHRAISSLGFPADQVVAFEDSEFGVLAAHSAGIDVYQIPDLLPPTTTSTKHATGVYRCFDDVLHSS
ncbi:MAG: HAD family phosphatase [Candidatus Thiodiazotropha sp.]